MWGRTNDDCHAALLCMWLQYDHVLPHSRGGDNSVANIVLTCAACNYGRMSLILEEVGLLDPAQNLRRRPGKVASIKALARREGLCNHYTSRMLPLAYLAPDLADDILHGRQHRGVSLATLTAQPLPPNWDDQRQFVEGLGARCN